MVRVINNFAEARCVISYMRYTLLQDTLLSFLDPTLGPDNL
jgi:hypothetical protein